MTAIADVIQCPGCDCGLAITDDLVGVALECPLCHMRFRVYFQEDAAEISRAWAGELTEHLTPAEHKFDWPQFSHEWHRLPGDDPAWLNSGTHAELSASNTARDDSSALRSLGVFSTAESADALLHGPDVTEETHWFLAGQDARVHTRHRQTELPVRPHRGTLLMTLAMIGILGLGMLGTVAWRLAAADLRRMDRGEMDESGRQSTETAYVLGLVAFARTLAELAAIGLLLVLWQLG